MSILSHADIHAATDRLVAAIHPKKVILFGSYARGEATEFSDLDLMVVDPEMDLFHAMVKGRSAIGRVGIDVDVLAYDSATMQERADWCSSPIHWALQEGEVLYDANA